MVDLCGLTGDTRKNEQGRPLDGHSLKPFLLDPKTEQWDGPDAALTALFRGAKTDIPSEQSYTLRLKDWRYIRYSNGKEELYDHVNDPHEWTNLAGNPDLQGKARREESEEQTAAMKHTHTHLTALLLGALNLARALTEVPSFGILRAGSFQAFEIAYVWTRRPPGVTKSA